MRLKSSSNAHANQDPLRESPWEHVTSFLARYQSYLLAGLGALFLLLVLLDRLFLSEAARSEAQFLEAQTAFQKVLSSPSEASYQALQPFLKKYPELHAAYDASLYQTFLLHPPLSAADQITPELFRRSVRPGLDLYLEFSKGSLLIAHQSYAAALEQTLKLKESVVALDADQHPRLSALVLARLATLYAQLDQPHEARAVWEEAKKSPTMQKALAEISPDWKDFLQQYPS